MGHRELTLMGYAATASRRLAWSRRMTATVGRRAARRNDRQVRDLEGRHAGETVFVLGSGPQLGRLDERQSAALASATTIGVNRTQYAVQPRYFVSSYPTEVLLAAKRLGSSTTLLHARPRLRAPLINGALTVRRTHFEEGDELSAAFGDEPTLRTLKNVALTATHLALVLGARRVVFVGVEQNSAVHYYDLDPPLRATILEDVRSIRSRRILTTDHPYSSIDHVIDRLREPPAALEARPFYERSHVDTFTAYVAELERHGVEAIATMEESVVAKAGAPVRDLDDVLGD